MHTYKTEHGYVFFTEEPLTDEELEEINKNDELIFKIFKSRPEVRGIKWDA